MTNIQSIGGSMVWVAVAAVMMLITFEPVSLEHKAPGAATELASTAPAAAAKA